MDTFVEAISREFLQALFHMPLYKGFARKISEMYMEMRKEAHEKDLSTLVSEKPFEQILAAVAVLQVNIEEKDVIDALLYTAASGEYSIRPLLARHLERKNLFEIQYDSDDFPESYRLHTMGSFQHITKDRHIRILGRGEEKGSFVPYSDIARWLKENQ